MIAGIVGHQPEWTLVDAVWSRSQGNPFFAEELTAARHQPSLSPELKGVVMHRVDRLPAEARQLLRVVASAGPVADAELLDAVGLFDADALDRGLAEVIDRQILVLDPSQAGYRFRHELLREVVYEAMLPGERRRLHRLIATALAADPGLVVEGPGHRAGALAAHWWAAGDWTHAMEASLEAADAASAMWAFPEAHGHLERALSALDRLPAGAMADGRSPAAARDGRRRRLPGRLGAARRRAGPARHRPVPGHDGAGAAGPLLHPPRPQRVGRRRLGRRLRRRTGRRGRSCRRTRPRSSWPRCWPKRPAASC